jgi:hypothetical protein
VYTVIRASLKKTLSQLKQMQHAFTIPSQLSKKAEDLFFSAKICIADGSISDKQFGYPI